MASLMMSGTPWFQEEIKNSNVSKQVWYKIRGHQYSGYWKELVGTIPRCIDVKHYDLEFRIGLRIRLKGSVLINP